MCLNSEGTNIYQVRARATLRRHVRSKCHPRGEIKRLPCFNCHRTRSCFHDGKWHPIEAHHPDYERPLFVVWACFACHLLIGQGLLVPCTNGPGQLIWAGLCYALRVGDAIDYTLSCNIRVERWAALSEDLEPGYLAAQVDAELDRAV